MKPPAARRAAQLRQVLLHPYALYLLLTLLIFLSSGFNIGPVNDGWVKLATYLSGSPLYGINTTRVFGGVPRDLGMRLGGGSFVAWQGFLFLFTLLRGALFYEIVRRLFPGARAFAIACGLVALFQPADATAFWVDVTGVHMGLVTALAACLGALVYLQTGKRAAVLAVLLFQLVTCLTYSGFLLLMLVFPVGVWLLSWAEGKKAGWRYLIRCCWLPAAYLLFQALLVALHFGHEAEVADFRPMRILWGYGQEWQLFLDNSVAWLGDLRVSLLLWVLPAVALAALTARTTGSVEQPVRPPRFWMMLCLGLLALAVVSYFPYALSSVRVGARRQLFIAGVFLYMLPLLPLYFWLPRRSGLSWLPWALTVVIALTCGVVGLQDRAYWSGAYRGEERLLAGIAALAPQPARDTTFVVHLHDQDQADALGGFYNRRAALVYALRIMYDDHSLDAVFTQVPAPHLSFGSDGLGLPQSIRVNSGLGDIPYDTLVLLDYSPDGRMQLLERGWLQRQAPAGFDLKAYDPAARLGTSPSADSKVCVMLERAMRPPYCSGGGR